MCLRVFVRACAVESHSRGSFPLYNLFVRVSFSLHVRFATTVTFGTILALVRAFVCVFVRACFAIVLQRHCFQGPTWFPAQLILSSVSDPLPQRQR